MAQQRPAEEEKEGRGPFGRMLDWFYDTVLKHSAARTAVASFAGAILVGALLLTLPVSSEAGEWTSPVDALFTATSAICVTGLIVVSTPDHWSLFGELVILGLIQVGGLGIMTLGAFMVTMLQRRLSMRFESVLSDMVEAPSEENVWTLTVFIGLFTLVVEAVGAAILFFGWRDSFDGFWQCFYHSVFHSISAFCNAGFSLNNDSLVHYAGSIPVNVAIAGEIVLGGIGFMVVREVCDYAKWWTTQRRGKRPRLSTHTKLVLSVTAALIIIGAAVFLMMELGGSLSDQPWRTRILASIFQSVTPRTAGFNTVPMGEAALAPATIFLLMVLMYIGGSPGSTAGGIKTSTLGIMVASIIATLKGRNKAEMFHHSVPEETVHRVASIILLSVAVLVGGIFVMLITEEVNFLKVAFEATSAFGTVGLSMGLTGVDSPCTTAGKLVLTALMFAGRLGPITLVLGVAQLRDRRVYRFPEDRILVG